MSPAYFATIASHNLQTLIHIAIGLIGLDLKIVPFGAFTLIQLMQCMLAFNFGNKCFASNRIINRVYRLHIYPKKKTIIFINVTCNKAI